MGDVVLSAGVRQNLLALQNTSSLMSVTQNRLATGKKVNSALDNPLNFFTSSALSARASDLASILDSMSNGIKTLQAADNGLTAITHTVESMQASINKARQDASFKGTTFSIDSATIGTTTLKNLTFSGGAVGTTPVNVPINTTGAGSAATAGKYTSTANFAATTLTDPVDTIAFSIAVDGGSATAVTINQAAVQAVGNSDTTIDSPAELQSILTNAGVTGVTVSVAASKLVITSNTTGATSSVVISGYSETDANSNTTEATGLAAGASTAGAAAVAAGAVKTVDELVTAINGNGSLAGKVKASNDGGRLRITNTSTEDLTVVGASATDVNGGLGASNTQTVGGNTVRKNLITEFNELRAQLDKLADDSSFNGVNLLRGDTLKLIFNESNTSSIDITTQDPSGVNSAMLGITAADAAELSSDAALDLRVDSLHLALTTLRSQASALGSKLSIVQNRQEFTKALIATLQTGADNLVLADTNEEGANMLALQTRQQLSTTALSLSAQADQAVLRLFG